MIKKVQQLVGPKYKILKADNADFIGNVLRIQYSRDTKTNIFYVQQEDLEKDKMQLIIAYHYKRSLL
ncbi:MAG: hypothetical protein QM489_01135 [Candidatus Izemoplasma sp.]